MAPFPLRVKNAERGESVFSFLSSDELHLHCCRQRKVKSVEMYPEDTETNPANADVQDLPLDTIVFITGFVADAVTLCRLACTCRELSGRIRTNDELWERLTDRRWSRGDGNTVENDWAQLTQMARYERRHLRDKQAVTFMKDTASQLAEHTTGSLARLVGIGLRLDPQIWQNLLEKQELVFDAFRNLYFLHERHASQSSLSAWTVYTAGKAAYALHVLPCIVSLRAIIRSVQEHDRDGAVLERCAILAAKAFMTIEEVLLGQGDSIESYIMSCLDAMATILQERLDSDGTWIEDVRAVLTRLNVLFFNGDLMGFHGNSNNYYDFRNSLISHALRRKTGNPLALCIIYMCLCRRVGIHVDIIGLPGHIVLEVQHGGSKRLFIDVFRGGQFLTIEDCQLIAIGYGITFEDPPDFPVLSASGVLTRTLNNLRHSYSQGGNADHAAFEFGCGDSEWVGSVCALILAERPLDFQFLCSGLNQSLVTFAEFLEQGQGLLSDRLQ